VPGKQAASGDRRQKLRKPNSPAFVAAMVKQYKAFACKHARRYWRLEIARQRFELEDLEQLAFQGLVIAAQRFDKARGCTFMTYATWWVRQVLRRALDDSGVIRIPAHLGQRSWRSDFEQTHDEETVRLVRAAVKCQQQPLGGAESDALDVGLTHDPELKDYGPVYQALRRLRSPERRVLIDRFGLDGCPEQTLAAIGRRMGLSRERIRQIQDKALRELRTFLEQRGWNRTTLCEHV
jgi:RNA polymerase sigma factor (sigma-70 family)